ncbi:hypothetical protein [Desulfobacter hydrogenophilus]|uniref:hypothetical protein n=1 Tax=Desulfobacter hydrogenophilus TaxID=2291 RepID=UPI0013D2EBAA|nr:hypothetical protein [Desulfobacter hydrogenophilus]NDY73822.1 hypothetical protein [Desulfobacter hydrogenophilus]
MQINNLSALEIDRALSAIRKQQEEIYGMTDIDFLSGSTSGQFHGVGYCLSVRIMCYKQMNVV